MKSDRPYLQHILDAIERIESYAQDGRAHFSQDRRTQDAIMRNLEVIGEAVRHLSDALKAQYSRVPWRAVTGMRDRLIHGYSVVSLDLVWSAATEHLEALRETAKDALARLEAQDRP